LSGIFAASLYFAPLLIGAVAAVSALQRTRIGFSDFAGASTAFVCGLISLTVMFLRTGRLLQTAWFAIAITLVGLFAIWQSNEIKVRRRTESGRDDQR